MSRPKVNGDERELKIGCLVRPSPGPALLSITCPCGAPTRLPWPANRSPASPPSVHHAAAARRVPPTGTPASLRIFRPRKASLWWDSRQPFAGKIPDKMKDMITIGIINQPPWNIFLVIFTAFPWLRFLSTISLTKIINWRINGIITSIYPYVKKNKETFHIRLLNILDINMFKNGVELQKSAGNNPFFEFDDNVDIFAMMLGRALKNSY